MFDNPRPEGGASRKGGPEAAPLRGPEGGGARCRPRRGTQATGGCGAEEPKSRCHAYASAQRGGTKHYTLTLNGRAPSFDPPRFARGPLGGGLAHVGPPRRG
jgi:hypothetical protein